MTDQTNEIHRESDQARAGSTPHIVRYVLLFSTILAIGALSAIWITGALSTPDDASRVAETESSVSGS